MSESTQQRPPAPPSLPGHFLFGNAQAFYANRLRFLEEVARDHGDVVRYRLGCEWYCLVNEPREARFVLRDWDHIDNATSDGGFQLDHSFIAKNGKARVIPRSISHASICPRAVAAMHERIVAAVERSFTDWEDGQERDVLHDMMRMNLEVVSEVLFGRPADAWLGPVMHVLTDLQMLIGAYTTSEETRDRMQISRRREIFLKVEAMVEELLAGITSEDEVPSLRIFRRAQADGRLSEREVIHEMCVLLLSVASTAVSATWTWACLSRNPQAWERLEYEVDTLPPGPVRAEDLEGLTYLHRVLKESMRLMPPLGVLHRKVEHDWDRGWYRLAEGESLHVSPYLLHRHPAHWREPELFRPERFDPDSQWHHPEQDVAYMPFAVGVRQCIGETLAWHQLQIMVASVARRFRPEVADDYELRYDLSPLGSLHPVDHTLPVRVRERRPAGSVRRVAPPRPAASETHELTRA